LTILFVYFLKDLKNLACPNSIFGDNSRVLIFWKHLGREVSFNVLGIWPLGNKRLTTEISSRGRHTHGEEMYK
jgi:hypothetical protein